MEYQAPPHALAPLGVTLAHLARLLASPRGLEILAPHVTDGRCCLVSGLSVKPGIGKVMVVRVFVAGGAGVVGRPLVAQLVVRGHQVTATTTGPGKLGLLAKLGADGVVMDGLDAASVGEAVAKAQQMRSCTR